MRDMANSPILRWPPHGGPWRHLQASPGWFHGLPTGSARHPDGVSSARHGVSTLLGAPARACQRGSMRGFGALGRSRHGDFTGFQGHSTPRSASIGLGAAFGVHPSRLPTALTNSIVYHNEQAYTTRLCSGQKKHVPKPQPEHVLRSHRSLKSRDRWRTSVRRPACRAVPRPGGSPRRSSRAPR